MQGQLLLPDSSADKETEVLQNYMSPTQKSDVMSPTRSRDFKRQALPIFQQRFIILLSSSLALITPLLGVHCVITKMPEQKYANAPQPRSDNP